MKTHRILTHAIAALFVVATPARAEKKSGSEKVVDTVIDALLGDDPKQTPAKGQAKAAPKAVADAGNLQAFAGKWNVEGGADVVTVAAQGDAARVTWNFANGKQEQGVGIDVGGSFYVGYGGGDGVGVVVFQVAGGKMAGTGASSKGVFAEGLTGPAGIAGKFESNRGETVTIKESANDSYLVVWSKSKRAGFGKKVGSKFVVAFHDTDANSAKLVIYALRGNRLEGQWWSDFGKKGDMENLARAGGAVAVAKPPRVDEYGNIIPDAPAPKRLEKPFDKPADRKPAARVAIGGPVVVPQKGAQVDIGIARRMLKADMDTLIAEFMKLHNDARAEVGVPPLQWDDKLAAYAQQWAENTAARSKMEHRPDGKYGENLAGYLPQYGERPVHGAKMWYDEKKDYNGEKVGQERKVVGHYTQMVWRKSTHVGFGIAMQKDGMVMLCANYSPAGNMIGEHPYNENGKR